MLRRATPILLVTALLLADAPPARAQPEDLERWIAVHSPNFVIWTDADADRGAEIAYYLELFRAVFARLAPGIELRSPTPMKIVAFRDGDGFAPYRGGQTSGGSVILGQFLRHRDGNFLAIDAGSRLVGAFVVLYHEYVHYLVDHNFPRVPRWFNEGLAEYYSSLEIEGDRVILGKPVERHVLWLRRDTRARDRYALSHDYSLREVLTGDAEDHAGRAGGFYAFSWALVHYLLSGERERLDQTADFLAALAGREDPEDAFEDAFDTSLAALDDKLRAYVAAGEFPQATFKAADLAPREPLGVAPMAPADVLFHLGDLLTRLGRIEAAERHFRLALEHRPEHPEALAGLALVRDLEGRLDEAEVLYRDALALGSTDPLTYIRYGRHALATIAPEGGGEMLVAGKLGVLRELGIGPTLAPSESRARAQAKVDEALRAFARASELDSDFVEPRALYGYAHLFGDADPHPGIVALRHARTWLPDRYDLTFFLLQLHLKAGTFDAARWLLERELEGWAPEPLVLLAREEIERATLLHAAAEALDEGWVEEGLEHFDRAIAVTSDQDLRDRMAERLETLQTHYQTPPPSR